MMSQSEVDLNHEILVFKQEQRQQQPNAACLFDTQTASFCAGSSRREVNKLRAAFAKGEHLPGEIRNGFLV